jgi:chain length determinant protein EpsF
MNVSQILLVLRLRWPIILGCAVLATLLAAGAAYLQPKMYTSQTALLLDVKSDPLVATFMPSIASPAFLATQSHIIRSDKVASAVVKRLGLESSTEAVNRWRQETRGKVPLSKYFADLLQRGLRVEPAPGTSVLNISFTSTDPRFAAQVANEYARAYIDFSVDLRTDPAKQYASWFDKQLKTLKTDLEQSQSRLTAAQKQSGIVSSDGKLDEEVAKLNALMQQLAATQVERADSAVKARNSGSETSPDIQANMQIQTLKARVSQLEATFNDVRSRFGPSHPQYQAAESQLTTAREQLTQEIRKATTTTYAVNSVSSQKVAELTALIENQKRKVLGMQDNRDSIDLLAKEVANAQRAYDAVAARYSQVALESQAEQSGARVLSVATEPLGPVSKTGLFMALGVLGGAAMGCAIAVALEFLDRRIRSRHDLEALEGLPVLAILNVPPQRNGHKRLALWGTPKLLAPPKSATPPAQLN